MGRLEEALECTRLAERRSPFGVPPFMRNNEIRQLNALGRVDEARAVARSSGQLTVSIEIQAGNWAVVERRSDSLLTSAALDEETRVWSLLCLASAQSSRGAFKAAARTFESAEAVARAGDLPTSLQNAPRRGRMMLAVASEGALPLPGDAWARDSSTMTLLTRGLRAAIAEDRPEAQRLLDAARSRWANSPPELAWQGATPALLEARIAALAGHWEEAARILRPVAYQRVEYGTRIPCQRRV